MWKIDAREGALEPVKREDDEKVLHFGGIRSLRFLPGGLLVTGGLDGKVGLWKIDY